jgi:hypothetical protein
MGKNHERNHLSSSASSADMRSHGFSRRNLSINRLADSLIYTTYSMTPFEIFLKSYFSLLALKG